MARFEKGSAVDLEAGPCLDITFLLKIGREVGVCLGLVSVKACSLLRTGESCRAVDIFRLLMGEPFDEDTISSITGDPCFMELLLLINS